MQYNESNFDFLCRLASRYGEWVYYDGKDLVFGDNVQETSPLCIPSLQEWQKTRQKVTMGDKTFVMEESRIQCSHVGMIR